MKPYILYVINTKTVRPRDIILNAMNASHARILGEQCCLRENEKLLCSYSKEMEPIRNVY